MQLHLLVLFILSVKTENEQEQRKYAGLVTLTNSFLPELLLRYAVFMDICIQFFVQTYSIRSVFSEVSYVCGTASFMKKGVTTWCLF